MNREPIVTIAGIVAVVTAALALLRHFGVIHMTDDTAAEVLAFVAALAPLLVAFIARHWTTPTAQVVAYQTGSGLVVAGDASPVETGTPVDVTENPEVGVPDDSAPGD